MLEVITLECPSCGGRTQFSKDTQILVCDYCGNQHTFRLPDPTTGLTPAAFLGEKKVYLSTEREAEQWTGLQAGGISPLALLNKGFQVVLDDSAREQAEIHVSGGQRGLNLLIPVDAFVHLTKARVASVSRSELV